MGHRVEISKRVLLINSASGALAKILNLSVLLWLNQYLLRRISAEEFALYPLLTSVILLLPVLTSVLTAGLGRYVLAAYARSDDWGVTQIVSTMLPILALASTVLLAVGWLFAWHIDKFLAIPPERLWDARIMMALLTFNLAMRVVSSPFGVGIYVRQKYTLYNIMQVLNQLFRALLLFVLLYGVSASVLWVVVANVIAEAVLLLATRVVSIRVVPGLRFDVRAIQWGYARKLISFGGWNVLGQLADSLGWTAIPLILNKLATNMDVTVFHVGTLASRQISLWWHAIAAPLYPMMTGMYAVGAHARIRSAYTRGGRLALWAMLLPALPAIIYAETVIRLYTGNQYTEAGFVMALSLASIAIGAGGWMLWPLANAAGRVQLTGAMAFGSRLALIASAFYVVGKLQWGAFGVAVASFLVHSLASVTINWLLGQRLAGIRFDEFTRRTLVPGLTPGCVASVIWVLFGLWFRPDSWAALGLCTLAGVIVYLGVLLGFCLEPQDKRDYDKVISIVYQHLALKPRTE
jgi:O-antigen/teichoic acid export membrane protein